MQSDGAGSFCQDKGADMEHISLRHKEFRQRLKKHGSLFVFYIPAAVFAIIFSYIPMLGLVMAFKENPNLFSESSAIAGIIKAEWVGLDNFVYIFKQADFLNALRNTLIISALKIVIVFPLPIILAILLTEVKGRAIKRGVQLTMYLPYFLSWAIIGGIFSIILNKNTGAVNNIIDALGFDRRGFIVDTATFRGVVVLTTAWKDIGWSTVTYIAAIMEVDTAQTEAAKIDGATKFQQIMNVTLPGIMPTIAVLFILRIGSIMDAGFEQIFTIYSPFVQETGDILGTFTYRLLRESFIPEYARSTAVGFFNSFVAFFMVIVGNYLSKKLFNRGIW